MKAFIYIPLLISLFAGCIQAQTPKNDCDCAASFRWVRQTFEKNDAGYTYAISQKGKSAYEAHNQRFEQKVKTITKPQDCFSTLFDWLRFFRSGHIAIRPKISTNNQASQSSKEAIIAQYKDWERFEMSEATLKQRLAKLKKPGLEGIWVSPPYKIGIVKKGTGYIGFIIEADGAYWRPRQVKLKIEPAAESGQYKARFFMRNHSLRKFDRVHLLEGNILSMGSIMLKRHQAKLSDDFQLAWQLAKAQNPVVKRLSKETLVLRIPSFNGTNKKIIDSVLKANHKAITSTKNLIIDIKNGTGGSDRSYKGILPYVYTNPIRNEGVAFYSTPLNNSRMDKLAAMPQFSQEEKDWFNKGKKTLDAKLGQFVNLSESGKTYSMTTYDEVYEYPKNVAIIINQGNGSTDEQFLLTVKQSRKVKLFGTTTFGVLDISNMHFVLSPCKQFELGYCLTKSYRIPHMAIDGKGIQPDYAFPPNLHELEWLKEVQKIVEQWK